MSDETVRQTSETVNSLKHKIAWPSLLLYRFDVLINLINLIVGTCFLFLTPISHFYMLGKCVVNNSIVIRNISPNVRSKLIGFLL